MRVTHEPEMIMLCVFHDRENDPDGGTQTRRLGISRNYAEDKVN